MRLLGIMALGMLVVGTAAPAQDVAVEKRVTRLEKEMRAVQRKVFPGGAGAMVEAENRPGTTTTTSGEPASAPVTDLIGRVDALESQLARVTGKVEEQGNRIAKLETRLKALETAGATAAVVPVTGSSRGAATAPAEPIKAAATDSRVAAVAAIEKPATSDPGEDSYIYGYRLWEAKFYPEAQTQLAETVKKYPKHARASHARNLLGRAWLDEGKPATSTQIFLDNYQTDPRGERAPDSLYYLGVALHRLKKNKEACQAFDELASVYPDIATGRLSDRLASGRKAASCGG